LELTNAFTEMIGATRRVRFGSKADLAGINGCVCFVPILLKNSSCEHFGYIAENAISRPS
jgi:hypothetical protein